MSDELHVDEWLLGWKATWYRDGLLYSATSLGSVVMYGRFVTERPIGCGPLCVFSTREAAQEFVRNADDRMVFPCAYVPSAAYMIWVSSGVYPQRLKDGPILNMLPTGTCLAEKVYVFTDKKELGFMEE